MLKTMNYRRLAVGILTVVMVVSPLTVLAQGTRISMPKNKYAVADDVKLGQQASAEVAKQMPLFAQNSSIDRYVTQVGQRLVAAIPQELRQPEFNYQFDVVNARDINAFALPGGPMFVNRGMIEAAATEGEMAGVMAHEISHVALRHATAQATKQQSAKFQLPALGGAILGAIIGGNLGGLIYQGSQIGIGAYLLKYSREYESQADILGAQIMARAGYDPRDLANMFKTIESEAGGANGPEWLSSHPNPGNRYERIIQEAEKLRVSPGTGRSSSSEFIQARNELKRLSPAPTMAEIAKKSQTTQEGGTQYPSDSRIESRVELPSTSYRTYSGGNLFRVGVPSNWQQFEEQSSVTFAPRGAYGNYQGQPVFTHGAIIGVVNAQTTNLERASDAYVGAILRNNSYLQPQGNYRRGSISGRSALSISLAGQSPVTGQVEIVNIYTTMLRDGNLFYVVNVVPRNEYSRYQRAFNTMVRSITLNN